MNTEALCDPFASSALLMGLFLVLTTFLCLGSTQLKEIPSVSQTKWLQMQEREASSFLGRGRRRGKRFRERTEPVFLDQVVALDQESQGPPISSSHPHVCHTLTLDLQQLLLQPAAGIYLSSVVLKIEPEQNVIKTPALDINKRIMEKALSM